MALTPESPNNREQKLEREQEVLMREVDEAVRKAELDSFARRYGLAIGGGIVLALGLFGGWLVWTDYREGQLEARSEKLVAAFDMIDAGRIEQAAGELLPLSEEGSSATAVSAKFARAGIALRDNRRDEAIELYESIADDEDAPRPYRDLAAIRSMAIQFDGIDPQRVIDRLKSLATPGNPWFGSAGELVAMAYLKQNKTDLAGPLLVAIAQDESVPQTLRSRTRQVAGQLGYDAIADVDETLAEVREGGGAPGLPAVAPTE